MGGGKACLIVLTPGNCEGASRSVIQGFCISALPGELVENPDSGLCPRTIALVSKNVNFKQAPHPGLKLSTRRNQGLTKVHKHERSEYSKETALHVPTL